ncbi:HAMP domain-containing histidine kinase [Marinilongibacter aquaticus]|uniref:sensor histidine kinase n=1 Tax=Marinilongibacter aquaticus TaxID=2975157 RepID=UPI0021BD1022|nr:HAMP domain-containing sensor histidine kinase [Marinilongibacter aquaticus]UBM60652.1 HAMP domain-containing histidine kinase [Marinilongibacter aquaticus]
MIETSEKDRLPEQIKALQEEFDEFIYLASHDLKEPARKIVTFGDRLTESLKGKLTAEEHEFFKRMMKAAKRQQAMIDDLLRLSRIKTTTFKKEKIYFHELVDSLIVSKSTDFRFEVPQVVYGDRRQLTFAMQELLHNAEKFSPGQPIIRLESRSIFSTVIASKGLNSSRNYAYLVLSDQGIGISNEVKDDIFRPFFRVNGKLEFPGSGMGLSIIKAIFDKMGGAVWAEPGAVRGASIHILLPTT